MNNTKVDGKNKIRILGKKAAVIAFWLLVWQLLAFLVDNVILMVSPWKTLLRLIELLGEKNFYATAGMSLLRIGAGFLAGFLAGVALAALAGRFPLAEQLFGPMMSLLKAVPVASFVVLLLIWWGSSFLAVSICFLVVLPNIYLNTLEGLKSTDRELLEMAAVFRLPLSTRFFYIYRPSLRPFLSSGMKLALGMCWKSGVAAEVIGTPANSIGGQLYLSKIYLDTAGVFAWTAAVILLSVLFEHIVLFCTELFFTWQPACTAPGSAREQRGHSGDNAGKQAGPITLSQVEKSFALPEGQGRKSVISQLSAVYEPGETYYLTSPSGSGKTTLLRLLAGLEEADSGAISVPRAVSMVFQEDRLCMDYSALKNVEMITGDAARAAEALKQLLQPEDMEKPCSQLSGGMKRRVALARAMEAESQHVFLDEPFTGMDARTKAEAEAYIRQKQQGRTLIIATHI